MFSKPNDGHSAEASRSGGEFEILDGRILCVHGSVLYGGWIDILAVETT